MKRLGLIVIDLAAFYGSLAIVLTMRYGNAHWQEQYALHVVPFTLLCVVWLFSLYIANLYEIRTLRNERDFFERLVQALGIAGTLSVLFFYLIPYFGITPKTNLFLFLIVSALAVTGGRAAWNRLCAGGRKKQLLMIGINDESLDLARFVTSNPQLGWDVCALVRLPHHEAEVSQEPLPLMKQDNHWQILDSSDNLVRFIHANRIDTIVISPQAYTHNILITELMTAIAEQVNFASLASFAEWLTGMVPVGAINQQWFLENITEGSKKTYETIKRIFDIGSASVLGVATLIITPLVALAIRLDSRGPIFFRQRRTGCNGKQFDIVKFRTMLPDAEHHTGAVWASEHDPRITRVGRFLRKTRIDELPQFWNILKCQMSLVGPRAERPEFDRQLAREIPFYSQRYLIKPGLSGWAQINYPYGASTQDAMKKLRYDLYYIKNRSLILDLEVVLKTISISLRRAGR